MSKLVVKETVTREIEVSFPEVVSLVRALPISQKEQLRRMLAEEEAGLSMEDQNFLEQVFVGFREELEQLGTGTVLSSEKTHGSLPWTKEVKSDGRPDNLRTSEGVSSPIATARTVEISGAHM